MSVVSSNHIRIDDRNVVWIDQTNIKVLEIALDRIAHVSSVEEIIVDQHKGLVSLAQVYSALAHYYDHEDQFNAELEHQMAVADQLRNDSLESPGRMKLRRLGLLK